MENRIGICWYDESRLKTGLEWLQRKPETNEAGFIELDLTWQNFEKSHIKKVLNCEFCEQNFESQFHFDEAHSIRA